MYGNFNNTQRWIAEHSEANLKMNIKKIKLLIIGLLLCVIYAPTFVWMKYRFLREESYYTHGFLVPLVVVYLVWRKRDELAKLPVCPQKRGLVILIFSLLIHVVAFQWKIFFISGFTMIATLTGLILFIYGKRILKELLFPLFFLIFMIPLPMVLIIHISFHLKIFVSQIAANVVNITGIHVVRKGSEIVLPNTSLMVGSPCSGLRSLISLTALGSLYAYLVDLSKLKKVLLFLASIPLALIANIIRVVTLLLVAYVYGSKVATGKFHDYSGFLIFIFAFLGLKLTESILSWKKKKQA